VLKDYFMGSYKDLEIYRLAYSLVVIYHKFVYTSLMKQCVKSSFTLF
jgi:5-methylcytosine-specific restriction endonuclease McrBC regulatory subunit McrC